MSIRLLISILLLSLMLPAPAVTQELYDVVILGGRVMDPETNFDAVRSLGIDIGAAPELVDGHLVGV